MKGDLKMKKASGLFWCFLLIICAFLTFTVSANAQKITKKNVPSAVISAFAKHYPKSIVISYSKEERNGKPVYEIESRDGKLRRDIIYSADGTALEIEERILPPELPDSVKQTIYKAYPKSEIKSAERLTRGKSVQYEVVITKGEENFEVAFDKGGKVLRTTKTE
jgi:hypothetical protein